MLFPQIIASIPWAAWVFFGLLAVAIAGAAVAERLCSIRTHVRSWTAPMMSRSETEQRFGDQQRSIDALAAKVEEVDESRSRDIRAVFEEMRASQKSFAACFADIARALGRIEGRLDVGSAVSGALEKLNHTIETTAEKKQPHES